MKARGFTLVEVLVALVIVAAGASAVLSALNSAASSTVYLREKSFAQWIAGNRIAETRLATTPPQNGKTEGELDYASRRWKWRQTITDGEVPGLRRIDVSVRPIVPGAREPTAGADDWTRTVSGVLGRDIAAPGSTIDWEPAPTAPGDGARPGPGPGKGPGTSTGTGGNTSAGNSASGATGDGGATRGLPVVGEGPRT